MTRLAPDRLGHLIPESFLQPGKQSVESLAAQIRRDVGQGALNPESGGPTGS